MWQQRSIISQHLPVSENRQECCLKTGIQRGAKINKSSCGRKKAAQKGKQGGKIQISKHHVLYVVHKKDDTYSSIVQIGGALIRVVKKQMGNKDHRFDLRLFQHFSFLHVCRLKKLVPKGIQQRPILSTLLQ